MIQRSALNAETGKSALVAVLWAVAVKYAEFLPDELEWDILAIIDPIHMEAFVKEVWIWIGASSGGAAWWRSRNPVDKGFTTPAVQQPVQAPTITPAPPIAERAAVVSPPAVVAAPVVSGALNMQQLRAELKRDEGIRHKIYEDSLGLKTAGIGRLITPDMPEYQMPVGTPVSDDQVQAWFSEDVSSAIADAKAVVDDFDSHPKPVKHALVNMAFNMGRDRLSKFKQTLRLINNRQYEEASAESLNSKWAEQVKSRSARVAGMISSGELSHNLA